MQFEENKDDPISGKPQNNQMGFSEDRESLRENLNKFLTYKYFLNAKDLEETIESPEWEKEKFTDWSAIRQILTYRGYADAFNTYTEDKTRGITVILPENDDDPSLNFRFLKGAAYFPYQLDPRPFYGYEYDKDILIQLSFAVHAGYWRARNTLSKLDLKFRSLQSHLICREKEIPFDNTDECYYELTLPSEYWGKSSEGKQTLPFDPKADAESLSDFCDGLIKIARTGRIPEELKKFI